MHASCSMLPSAEDPHSGFLAESICIRYAGNRSTRQLMSQSRQHGLILMLMSDSMETISRDPSIGRVTNLHQHHSGDAFLSLQRPP